MRPFKVTGIQYGALPYRLRGRQVDVMLITSRRTRRWIIPKGWPINGLKPKAAAALEAEEEAGIAGRIAERPIGSYRYLKSLKGEETMAIQVIVFPLRVEEHIANFKEKGQRVSAWFDYREAALRVSEPSLRRLIRDFGVTLAPSVLGRGLRAYHTWRFGGRG